jgi:hypothetical protein
MPRARQVLPRGLDATAPYALCPRRLYWRVLASRSISGSRVARDARTLHRPRLRGLVHSGHAIGPALLLHLLAGLSGQFLLLLGLMIVWLGHVHSVVVEAKTPGGARAAGITSQYLRIEAAYALRVARGRCAGQLYLRHGRFVGRVMNIECNRQSQAAQQCQRVRR